MRFAPKPRVGALTLRAAVLHAVAQSMTSRTTRTHSGRPARIAARRAPPPAPRLGGADAERARRRSLLEGVRLADRARQDAADARNGQVARARGSASTPRSSRRGVSSDERARAEAILTRAEALVGAARLRRRDRRVHRRARGRRRDRRGRASGAGALGRGVGPRPPRRGQARDRAARAGARPRRRPVLHRSRPRRGRSSASASARYLISSISTAIALFGEALALVDRSPLPSDLLRANVLTWRSRCYRRQRDFEAARDDVDARARARGVDGRRARARRGRTSRRR